MPWLVDGEWSLIYVNHASGECTSDVPIPQDVQSLDEAEMRVRSLSAAVGNLERQKSLAQFSTSWEALAVLLQECRNHIQESSEKKVHDALDMVKGALRRANADARAALTEGMYAKVAAPLRFVHDLAMICDFAQDYKDCCSDVSGRVSREITDLQERLESFSPESMDASLCSTIASSLSSVESATKFLGFIWIKMMSVARITMMKLLQ